MKTPKPERPQSEILKPTSVRTLESGRIGLAQSVERLTAEWEVAGSIPGTGPILRVLK